MLMPTGFIFYSLLNYNHQANQCIKIEGPKQTFPGGMSGWWVSLCSALSWDTACFPGYNDSPDIQEFHVHIICPGPQKWEVLAHVCH